MGYEENLSRGHRITSKGQVTIPKAIRERLGLKPGELVMFELGDDGQVRILSAEAAKQGRRDDFRRRLKRAQEIFRDGDAFPGMSTDEFMAMIREPLQPFEIDKPNP